MLDLQKIRADFPILSQKVNGKPLVYFDNGATSQKPQVVIDAISKYYQEINANIHRGVHTLSQLATDAYEVSRGKIQQHINAKFAHEVLFTSGTTHGINLVANGFASILKSGDEVLVSARTNGIVTLSTINLLEGKSISKEQNLFSISGEDLSENNSTVRYMEAQNNFENGTSPSTYRIFEHSKLNKLEYNHIIYESEDIDVLNYFGNRLEDIDKDGDIDIVAGNQGLNNQYVSSEAEPVEMFYGDFDNNGTQEPVIAYYIDHKLWPIYSRDDLMQQLPSFNKRFIYYSEYAKADMKDILGENLKTANHYTASQMSSIVLENTGKGFVKHSLPIEAQ